MARSMVLVLVSVSVSVLVLVLTVTAHETTGSSWTACAEEKVQRGLGLKYEQPVEDTVMLNKDKIEQVVTGEHQFPSDSVGTKEKAYETSSEAYEKAQQAKQTASETAQDASNKVSSLKNTAHEAKNKAQQFTKQASEKTNMIKDKAQNAAHIANEARETLAHKAKEKAEKWTEEGTPGEEGEHTSWVTEKTKEGYNAAKARATKTLHNAKEMAKDVTSPQYDDEL